MSGTWTDEVVAERMAVDQSFSEQIAESRFSNGEWSLIMTATEFEIESPADPEAARIVANTEKVEHVLPELEAVRAPLSPGMDSSGGDGLLGRLLGAVGIGGADDYTEERAAADRLTAAYAEELQATLEENGRWERVCELATR